MKSLKLSGIFILLGVIFIFSFGLSQMKKTEMMMQHKETEAAKGKEITIEGHIIDPYCYITMDMIGEKHKKCAQMCAKNGINLGILEKDTNIIYLVFPEGHGNPNEKVMEFIEEDVKISGKLWQKGSLNAIQIEKIEKMK